MDNLVLCPTCLSKYPDIRGMVYPYRCAVGHRCEDKFHAKPERNPDDFTLSVEDRVLLSDLHIQIEPGE